MAAGLRMSTSVVVTLALHEDLFLGVFGLIVFLADLELWDLDFLVGFGENTWFNHSSINMSFFFFTFYFTIANVNLASVSDQIFICKTRNQVFLCQKRFKVFRTKCLK